MREERLDAEFIDCPRCRATGEYVECIDDLCHAKGRCIHGDNTCKLCGGCGRISRELDERWAQRNPFGSVELPDPDQDLRGVSES